MFATFALLVSLTARADAEDSAPGYAADGRTSASILAAKRSHQVADRDALGLSVFSGLIVIGLVAFWLPKLFDK
ncbi:hypothetical protein [Methylomonas rhizoryzae]|uniref:hypothetical protein n=1 Tax=Methylomonas rhizoryzae TaxID=2608981 RepID=UPI0012325814|nr:hypothetical protein [Methylomonas rhizoryzae]